MRNALCFQGVTWSDVQMVLRKASRMLRRWKSLCKEDEELRFGEIVEELDRRAAQPLHIGWTVPGSQAAPEAWNSTANRAGGSSGFGWSMEPDVAAQNLFFSVAQREGALRITL